MVTRYGGSRLPGTEGYGYSVWRVTVLVGVETHSRESVTQTCNGTKRKR